MKLTRVRDRVDPDLLPGTDGRNKPVTEENKKEYVHLYSKWRLNRGTEEQLAALKRGFNEIIDMNHLTIFDPKELEVRSLTSPVQSSGREGLCSSTVVLSGRLRAFAAAADRST